MKEKNDITLEEKVELYCQECLLEMHFAAKQDKDHFARRLMCAVEGLEKNSEFTERVVRRTRRFRWKYGAVAAILVACLAGYLLYDTNHIKEGTVIQTVDNSQVVKLSRSINLTIEPHSEVRVTAHNEISLEYGEVQCSVKRKNFSVVTDVGTVSVKGTKFRVKTVKGEDMKVNKMVVMVLAGTVMVSNYLGTEELTAGEKLAYAAKPADNNDSTETQQSLEHLLKWLQGLRDREGKLGQIAGPKTSYDNGGKKHPDYYNSQDFREWTVEDLKKTTKIDLNGLVIPDKSNLGLLIHLKNLDDLRLAGTGLKGEDLIHLEKLTSLKHLQLQRNEMDNKYIKHLSNLINLEYLDMFDSQGGKELGEELAKFTKLGFLGFPYVAPHVQSPYLSTAHAFHARMPDCYIKSYHHSVRKRITGILRSLEIKNRGTRWKVGGEWVYNLTDEQKKMVGQEVVATGNFEAKGCFACEPHAKMKLCGFQVMNIKTLTEYLPEDYTPRDKLMRLTEISGILKKNSAGCWEIGEHSVEGITDEAGKEYAGMTVLAKGKYYLKPFGTYKSRGVGKPVFKVEDISG